MDPIGRLPVWPGEDRMISVWQAVGSRGSRGLREERQCSRCATDKRKKGRDGKSGPDELHFATSRHLSIRVHSIKCLKSDHTVSLPWFEQVKKNEGLDGASSAVEMLDQNFQRTLWVTPPICNGFWCHYYVKSTEQILIERWQIWKHQTFSFLPQKCVLIT